MKIKLSTIKGKALLYGLYIEYIAKPYIIVDIKQGYVQYHRFSVARVVIAQYSFDVERYG